MTARDRIRAAECDGCKQGVVWTKGYHLSSKMKDNGCVESVWKFCTAPDDAAIIERLARENEALSAQVHDLLTTIVGTVETEVFTLSRIALALNLPEGATVE